MGIRVKLVLCLLAVLIPVVAVSAFAIRLFDQKLTERAESSLANSQRLEVARINEMLASYAQDARSLASDSHVKEFVSEINAMNGKPFHNTDGQGQITVGGYDGFFIVNTEAPWPLQQLALVLQHKAGIIGSSAVELRLVDRSGSTLGESVGFSWVPADITLVQRSMRSVKTLFGDAFQNDTDQRRLGMSTPIISDSGEVVGALLLEARLGPIIDLVSMHEGVGYSSEAHIAQRTSDGHAQLITALRFDRKAAFNKIVPQSNNLSINQALDAYGGRIITDKDYRGVNSIQSLETIPATGWGLVVKIDSAEAFEPVIDLRHVLLLAAVTSLIVILVGYTFCLVPIARRLKRTAAAAHKIMQGDLNVRVNDSNNDEIGNLARTIDTLAQALELDQRKRTEVEARLRFQALHDELTGLLNRKHANKVIKKLNDNVSKCHSIMFLDLNGFKDINDLYGHAAGDEVLVCIAKRLTHETPNGATLARWGGDEFVIILPGVKEKMATEIALNFHSVFDEPVVTSQGAHRASCSIGLATSSDTKSLDDVLVEADILMYEQKKLQHLKRAAGGMATRNMERALNNDRIEAWFQPLVTFKRPGTYELTGAEAQPRLRTCDGGIVMPEDFLPEPHDTDIGKALERRVNLLSIQSLSRWRVASIVDEHFKLTLNAGVDSFNDPDYSTVLICMLEESAIRPDQIILKIAKNCNPNPAILSRLRQQGMLIALDSAKARPATLDQLTELSPDVIRINQRWLKDPIIAPRLIPIYLEQKLRILVNGIESRDELPFLHNLGITHFQGSLFDPPLPAVDFISRWGQSSTNKLGQKTNQGLALRLAG